MYASTIAASKQKKKNAQPPPSRSVAHAITPSFLVKAVNSAHSLCVFGYCWRTSDRYSSSGTLHSSHFTVIFWVECSCQDMDKLAVHPLYVGGVLAGSPLVVSFLHACLLLCKQFLPVWCHCSCSKNSQPVKFFQKFEWRKKITKSLMCARFCQWICQWQNNSNTKASCSWSLTRILLSFVFGQIRRHNQFLN